MKEQIEEKEIKQKNNNKKTLIVSIIGVLVLIIAVAGISFAAWNYVFNGSLTNTLSTADISLELLESDDNIISITNALPMSDNEGKLEQAFDFVVTSKTTRDIDIDYTINIEKLSVDNGYTSLNDNQIKVYLTDNNNTQKLAPTLISNLSNYKLYKGTHSHDATHNKVQDKFKLRVWIDQNVDASSWNENTKLQYKFKIGISSSEHVDVPGQYTLSWTNSTQIGQTIPNDVTIYSSAQDAMNAWTDYIGETRPFYLKHILNGNNEIEESYVEFVVTEQMAQNNPGMVAGTYALKGGDSGASFVDNAKTIYDAFGGVGCYLDGNPGGNPYTTTPTSYFNCGVSGLYASADSDGGVGANDGDSDRCYVGSGGSSHCYEDEAFD